MIGGILRRIEERRAKEQQDKLKKEFVGRLKRGKDYGKVRRTRPPVR